MQKNSKKRLALTLCLSVALLLISVTAFAAPAKVAKQPKPAIANVGTMYSLGDVVAIKVNSTDYTKKVQYRVYLTNLDTKKKVELTKGYTKADYAKNVTQIKYSAKTAGKYSVTVYVKPYGVNLSKLPSTTKAFSVYNGLYISKANTVLASKTIKGNVYVKGNNVTINKVKVTGTVYIDPGSNGTTKLNNVVAANVRVLSGATKSIYLNSVSADKLYVDSTSKVRIVVTGTTQVGTTMVTSYAILDQKGGTLGTVTIKQGTHGVPEVLLYGTFDEPIIVGSSAKITAAANAKIALVKIAPSNPDSIVQLAGTFASVSVTKEADVKLAKGTVITDTLDVQVPVELTVGENAKIDTLNVVDGASVQLGNGTTVQTATGEGDVSGGTVEDNQTGSATPEPTPTPVTPTPTPTPVAPTPTPVVPTPTPTPVVTPTPTPVVPGGGGVTVLSNGSLNTTLNGFITKINDGFLGINGGGALTIAGPVSGMLNSNGSYTNPITVTVNTAKANETFGELLLRVKDKVMLHTWSTADTTAMNSLAPLYNSITVNGNAYNTFIGSLPQNALAKMLNTSDPTKYAANFEALKTAFNGANDYASLVSVMSGLIPGNDVTLNNVVYGGTLQLSKVSVTPKVNNVTGTVKDVYGGTADNTITLAEIHTALGIADFENTTLASLNGSKVTVTLLNGSTPYTYDITLVVQ